jgi:hypothetical protein
MYNNPYNRSYQQYYPQYPQYPQPTYQPVQQPIEQKIQDIKFLNAEQIKAYIVLPNTKEVLVDNENGLAYLVSADSMGVSTARKFSFKSLDEPKTEEKQEKLDMSQYVKTSDLDKFVEKADLQTLLPIDSIKSLENKLMAIESRLNSEKQYQETSGQTE